VSSFRIVGVDPGFANLGFCAIDLFSVGGSSLVDTKLVTTSPEKGKSKNISDELRRLAEIEDAFKLFLDEHKPDVLAMEEPGKCLMRRPNPITRKPEWVTNSSTLRTSCMMWGAIHGICRDRGIYCIKVGAQQIKKTLCNKKNASKDEVVAAVKARYPAYKGWPKSKKVEHVADAVGAAVVSFIDPVVMTMLRRLSS